MKCLQNIENDGLVFLGCIYPRLTTDNTAVGPIGPMGAGKLRAGVRVRALTNWFTKSEIRVEYVRSPVKNVSRIELSSFKL